MADLMFSAELIGEENIAKQIRKNSGLREAVRKVLQANSFYLQSRSQDRCPVDTGTLKRSIRWKWDKDDNDEMSTIVGTNVPYAASQEFDETFHHPRGGEWGYFRKSMAEVFPKFKTELENTLKRAA